MGQPDAGLSETPSPATAADACERHAGFTVIHGFFDLCSVAAVQPQLIADVADHQEIGFARDVPAHRAIGPNRCGTRSPHLRTIRSLRRTAGLSSDGSGIQCATRFPLGCRPVPHRQRDRH